MTYPNQFIDLWWRCYTSIVSRDIVSKARVFFAGLVLLVLGLVLYLPNSNASGPEAYEELYWAFGGCLLSLTGILVICIALLWRRESVDLDSNAVENETPIPPPVTSNEG